VEVGRNVSFHISLVPALGSFGSMNGKGRPATYPTRLLWSLESRTCEEYFSVASRYGGGHSLRSVMMSPGRTWAAAKFTATICANSAAEAIRISHESIRRAIVCRYMSIILRAHAYPHVRLSVLISRRIRPACWRPKLESATRAGRDRAQRAGRL